MRAARLVVELDWYCRAVAQRCRDLENGLDLGLEGRVKRIRTMTPSLTLCVRLVPRLGADWRAAASAAAGSRTAARLSAGHRSRRCSQHAVHRVSMQPQCRSFG